MIIRVCVAGALMLAGVCLAAGQAAEDYVVTKIRFHPRQGHAERMKGGRFSGSITSATNDFQSIAELKQPPAEGQWTTIELPNNGKAYRFLKWEGPPDSFGNIAEIEFYAGDRKLTGTPFGTTGARENPNNDPRLAFDGDPATFFDGTGRWNQYVGIDLGPESQVMTPALSLPSGRFAEAQSLAITCATPGATIRYGLNGSPNKSYSGPIRLDSSVVLQAVATRQGLADSTTLVAAYRIGEPAGNARDVASFHIGNSLTDTVEGWIAPIAQSGGHDLRYYRFTIPGAPTDWLWDHPGSGFGDSWYEQAFLARAPLSHLVTQPFAGHNRSIQNEARYSGQFYDLARRNSPDLQHWLYVQWPDKQYRDNWSRGKAGEEVDGKHREIRIAEPAATWQEACANHVKYVERVKAEMDKTRAAEIEAGKAKPVLIIPAGLALARLKTEVEAGRVAGISDFFAEHFSDDLHLSPKGRYMVALVHYACFFKESPEGKVTAARSGLNEEQARMYQRIAWETAKSYPHSGL